jgi:hypothetical protein
VYESQPKRQPNTLLAQVEGEIREAEAARGDPTKVRAYL